MSNTSTALLERSAAKASSSTGAALLERSASKSPAKTATEEKVPIMYVQLFGGLRIHIGGTPIDETKLSKTKMRLLLAHLVSRFGREVGRDTLIESLWPGFDKDRGLDNLYVVWSMLKRITEGVADSSKYFINYGTIYRINSRYVKSDVQEFDLLARKLVFTKLDRESLIETFFRMDELYTGDVLSGLRCDDYTMRMRDRYRNTYVDMLISSSRAFIDLKDSSMALWFARKALSIDSTREDVFQTLMMAQGIAGQRTAGMETYFMCKRYLDENLGISLSHKTIEIYEKLLNDEY
ncbi:MAG: hypothetical protein K6G78_07770 [bacterium]|nr:hypothetical protein [bacterium]